MYLIKLLPNFFTIFIYLTIIPEGDFSGKEIDYQAESSSQYPELEFGNSCTDHLIDVEFAFFLDYNRYEYPSWKLANVHPFNELHHKICAVVYAGAEASTNLIDCLVATAYTYSIKFRYLKREQVSDAYKIWKGSWPADFFSCNCSEATLTRSGKKMLLGQRQRFLVTKAPSKGFYKADPALITQRGMAFLTGYIWLNKTFPELDLN